MKAFALAVAALASLAAPVSAQEDEVFYQEFDDGWLVSILDDGCMAIREYDNDEFVAVSYRPKTDSTTVHVTSRAATSIQHGAEVILYPLFLGGDDLDRGWGGAEFVAYVDENGTRRFFGTFDGYTMVADMAKNDLVAFWVTEDGEQTLGTYRLDGSARAMASMRKCSFQVTGMNPNDPFLPR